MEPFPNDSLAIVNRILQNKYSLQIAHISIVCCQRAGNIVHGQSLSWNTNAAFFLKFREYCDWQSAGAPHHTNAVTVAARKPMQPDIPGSLQIQRDILRNRKFLCIEVAQAPPMNDERIRH